MSNEVGLYGRANLIAFLRGCAQAADDNQLGVDQGRLLVNGDLMRQAADLLAHPRKLDEVKPPLRLPHGETRWVWAIENPDARCLIKVIQVQFDEGRWWVTAKHLPEVRGRDVGKSRNTLSHFWKMVTPVDGRIADLSNPISESQFGKV